MILSGLWFRQNKPLMNLFYGPLHESLLQLQNGVIIKLQTNEDKIKLSYMDIYSAWHVTHQLPTVFLIWINIMEFAKIRQFPDRYFPYIDKHFSLYLLSPSWSKLSFWRERRLEFGRFLMEIQRPNSI